MACGGKINRSISKPGNCAYTLEWKNGPHPKLNQKMVGWVNTKKNTAVCDDQSKYFLGVCRKTMMILALVEP